MVCSHPSAFSQDKLVKFPAHLNWAEAACLPCAGLTAWSALTAGGTLQPGTSVLIQSTDGVSMMALEIARAAGCSILLISSISGFVRFRVHMHI
jgi:NADPH:quinone reductase-like Zn-dependent oxidoreductase